MRISTSSLRQKWWYNDAAACRPTRVIPMYDIFECIGSKRSLKRTRCTYVIWARWEILGQLNLPRILAGEFRAERIAQPVKGTATIKAYRNVRTRVASTRIGVCMSRGRGG